MDKKVVFQNLCIQDIRNPLHADIYGDHTPEEMAEKAKMQCWCDNCFYGRNELALEILHLRSLL